MLRSSTELEPQWRYDSIEENEQEIVNTSFYNEGSSYEECIAELIEISIRGEEIKFEEDEETQDLRLTTLFILNNKTLVLIMPDDFRHQYKTQQNMEEDFQGVCRWLKNNTDIIQQTKDFIANQLINANQLCIHRFIYEIYTHGFDRLLKIKLTEEEIPKNNNSAFIFANETSLQFNIQINSDGNIKVILNHKIPTVTKILGSSTSHLNADIEVNAIVEVALCHNRDNRTQLLIKSFQLSGYSEHSQSTFPRIYSKQPFHSRVGHWVKQNPRKSATLFLGLVFTAAGAGLSIYDISFLGALIEGAPDLISQNLTKFGLYAVDGLACGITGSGAIATGLGIAQGGQTLFDQCNKPANINIDFDPELGTSPDTQTIQYKPLPRYDSDSSASPR